MRWDPLMIRWCLYIRHVSGRGYDMLKESGVISLPFQRTLWDHTYFTRQQWGLRRNRSAVDGGSQNTVLHRKREMPCHSNGWDAHQRGSCLWQAYGRYNDIRDHKCIYYCNLGNIIGFTNLGEINSHLEQFDKSTDSNNDSQLTLANSMLVMMVKGLFSKLHFHLAQFPCTTLAGDQIFEPFWEAVSCLGVLWF